MSLPERDQVVGWVGKPVVGQDGNEIGPCTVLYADDDTGLPEWVGVARSGGGRLIVIPLLDAEERDGLVRVAFPGDVIEAAPHLDVDDHISAEDEVRLYSHYGVRHSDKESGSVLPAGETAEGVAADGAGTAPAGSDAASSGDGDGPTLSSALAAGATGAGSPARIDTDRPTDEDTTAGPRAENGQSADRQADEEVAAGLAEPARAWSATTAGDGAAESDPGAGELIGETADGTDGADRSDGTDGAVGEPAGVRDTDTSGAATTSGYTEPTAASEFTEPAVAAFTEPVSSVPTADPATTPEPPASVDQPPTPAFDSRWPEDESAGGGMQLLLRRVGAALLTVAGVALAIRRRRAARCDPPASQQGGAALRAGLQPAVDALSDLAQRAAAAPAAGRQVVGDLPRAAAEAVRTRLPSAGTGIVRAAADTGSSALEARLAAAVPTARTAARIGSSVVGGGLRATSSALAGGATAGTTAVRGSVRAGTSGARGAAHVGGAVATGAAKAAAAAASGARRAAGAPVAVGVGAFRGGRRATSAVTAAPATAASGLTHVVDSGRSIMNKIFTGMGFAVGYVLGAKAGRQRYEQIKQQASKVAERPEVQQLTEKVTGAAGKLQENPRTASGAQTARDLMERARRRRAGGMSGGGQLWTPPVAETPVPPLPPSVTAEETTDPFLADDPLSEPPPSADRF